MRFNKHEYRRASHERFRAASDAFGLKSFAVSHYLVGVSVECMLRAHRWAIDPSWDARHDLTALIKGSGVLPRIPEMRQGVVRDALNEVSRRWTVSHRYAPDKSLEAYLKTIIPSNPGRVLEDNGREMLRLNQLILEECDRRCP